MAHQPPTARAKRETNTHFVHSRGCARHHEAGDIDAGDEDYEQRNGHHDHEWPCESLAQARLDSGQGSAKDLAASEQLREFINGLPKYVVSTTLKDPSWHNTTLVSGDDVAGQLRAIKESTDGDIGMSGSATTVRWLLANGLLDELALLVHPIAVGSGERLFEGTPTTPLTLVHSEPLASGVLHLRYAPAAG